MNMYYQLMALRLAFHSVAKEEMFATVWNKKILPNIFDAI